MTHSSPNSGSAFSKIITGFVVCIVLASAAGIYWYQRASQALPELRTVAVEQRDLVITLGATGTIEPDEVIQIGPDVAGKIIQFGRDPENADKSIGVGSRVSKDTVIFELDPSEYEFALQKAQAAYSLAQADLTRLQSLLAQAKRTLDRAIQLRNTNTQSAFDEIQTAHELAVAQLAVGQARLKQAETEVRHAEISLEKTRVRSPIDGIVIDRRANLGQHVHIGHPGLFLLSRDLDHMRIRTSVSESDIGKVQVGQAATFTVDAHRDHTMTGHVDQILVNARRQGNFVTYDVLIEIDDADLELFPHMTADVEFEITRRDQAWLVPTGALAWWPDHAQIDPAVSVPAERAESDQPVKMNEGDQAYVWIPSDDGKVQPVPVQVGINDGVYTQIQGNEVSRELPVVVGVINKVSLARIIPTAKTLH